METKKKEGEKNKEEGTGGGVRLRGKKYLNIEEGN